MSALPNGSADPVMVKLSQAHKLIKEAHEELGRRSTHTDRSVARIYLVQSMQTLRRAILFEKRTQ